MGRGVAGWTSAGQQAVPDQVPRSLPGPLHHAEISRGGIDVEFHGDMRLLSTQGEWEYLARFTHGTLEWIRPLAVGEPWSALDTARVKFAGTRLPPRSCARRVPSRASPSRKPPGEMPRARQGRTTAPEDRKTC